MNNLKALIVILALSMPVFWIAKTPACEFANQKVDFDRRRNLWIAVTLLAFASNSFWVYMIGGALLVAFGAQREPNRLAMFLALMMAVPAFEETLPGFGDIAQIFTFSHLRMLSVVLLLPAYLVIRRQSAVVPFGRTTVDKILLGYVLLRLLLTMTVSSSTVMVRASIYAFTDIFLPYYVASRGLRDLAAFRDALMTLVVAVVLMAPVAMFESLRYWLLYSGLGDAMGVTNRMGAYLTRGGELRAIVTGEHSIILGYLAAVVMGLFWFVRRSISSRLLSTVAISMLVVMLVATGSRGPWLGAAAVLFVILLSGPDKMKRASKGAVLVVPVLAALSFTEFGQKLFDYLPFIGTADTATIDYRQRLFEISVPIILQNPLFGAFDYLRNPAMQELIQGEGIIDVVNTYLGVALTYGLVGLTLFCSVFAFSGWGVWSALRRSEPHSEINLLGRALLAALAGMLVTIVSASSIGIIPWVYWVLAGFCVSYTRLSPEPTAARAAAPVRGLRVGA